MSKIENIDIHGLSQSIFRSGYPMRSEAPTREEFKSECDIIATDIILRNFNNLHIERAIKLANAKGGGHDQFLTGVQVSFDLTFSNKAMIEAERYTFLNFISSMSTMHRVSALSLEDMCNQYVSKMTITYIKELQNKYNSIDEKAFPELKKESYLELLYNLPSGFELMAGMTTNYRCLKNIYAQRKTHRLPDWKMFCVWIESLPMGKELLIGGVK